MRPDNRSQLMSYLGAEQRNTVWSWCAVNEEEKKVYLSVWQDTRKKGKVMIRQVTSYKSLGGA